jgi:putative lipoic acid-binding regulatory protein
MNKPEQPIFKFPTPFNLRVMGEDQDDFKSLVFSIVKRHVPELNENTLTVRPSSEGRFISVMVPFTALSKDQVDAIYIDLSGEKRVLMVL